MVISSDKGVDARIAQMRKDNCGLFRIHKWLSQWDNFSQLDEIVVLCHILNVLDTNSLAATRSEVRYTFNKFYNFDFHDDKRDYLKWIYKEFHIKLGAVVSVSRSHRCSNESKKARSPTITDKGIQTQISTRRMV